MKVYKKSASIIKEAINFWRTEGVISESQADKLVDSIEVLGFSWKKLSIFIILLSISFLFIASISFIEELEKYFGGKIIVCLIVAAIDALFYGVGAYGKAKWPERFYSNGGMLFLGVLFTPCAITMLHTSGVINSFSTVILISYIIYVVLGVLLQSKLIWCFSLIAFGYWISMQIGDYHFVFGRWIGIQAGNYYMEIGYSLIFILFGSVLIGMSMLMKSSSRGVFLHRTTLVVGLLYLFIFLWVASIFGNYSDLDLWYKIEKTALLHWSLVFAAAALRAIYYGIKYNDSVVCNFGVTFLIINLYTRYSEYLWNYLHQSLFFSIIALSLWIIAIKAEKIFNLSSIYNHDRAIRTKLN